MHTTSPTTPGLRIGSQHLNHGDNEGVDAKTCASQVGSSASSLYKLAKMGVIPCLRVGPKGRGLRFIPSEVRQALQNRPAWTLTEESGKPRRRLTAISRGALN